MAEARACALALVSGAAGTAFYMFDILPALKNRDSSSERLMSEREDVLGCVDIAVVCRPALRAALYLPGLNA